jgi:hypothetical protein
MDYLEVQAAMDTIHRIKTNKAKNTTEKTDELQGPHNKHNRENR